MKKHILAATVVIAVIGGVVWMQFHNRSKAQNMPPNSAPQEKVQNQNMPAEEKQSLQDVTPEEESTSPESSRTGTNASSESSDVQGESDEVPICTCGCGEDILSCNCETAQQMRKEHFEQSG